MSPPVIRSAGPLRDVLYEFTLAKSTPDADLLEEFIRKYPQHAEALTDFAIEWALSAASEGDASTASATEPSPVVERAMSRFHNRLYQVRMARSGGSGEEDPFDAHDRKSLREVADRVGVNTLLLMKVRDRQIDPDTIPANFRDRLARELGSSETAMRNYLRRPAQPHGAQRYKADGKPQVAEQVSFEDAVRSSSLSAEQAERLLRS